MDFSQFDSGSYGGNKMYTWGYIKNAALAKLDLDSDQDEAVESGLLNKFTIFANEAMTQICSAVKPKRKFYTVHVFDDIKFTQEGVIVNGKLISNYNITPDNRIEDLTTDTIYYPVGYRIVMPTDFVSFSDDNSTVEYYDFLYNKWSHICHDDDIDYQGYSVVCKHRGDYSIAYNARWFNFIGVKESDVIDAPADVLDCIASYIASQCYKADDEYKSSIFRNEYEMFLARIDNTDFKNTHTFTIEGDW